MDRNEILKRLLPAILFFTVIVFKVTTLYCKVIYIPDDFETIQEGIDESLSGDTILISPGTYYENIRMKDGITVSGTDAELTIITDDGEGPPDPVVEMSCDCTLKNVTVTGARGAGMGHAIVVMKGSPKVLNNIVRDNNYTGIGIHSEVIAARAVVSGNKIYGNGGAGISNLGSAADNIIEKNRIYENNNLGIVVLDNGRALIRENDIRENGVGVVAKTGGKAIIENNYFEKNKTVGITVREEAYAELRYNRIVKNGTPGISIDDSEAKIINNEITQNGTIGIYYKNNSKGILEGNDISGMLPNLVLVQSSQLTIVNNKILGSPEMRNTITLKKAKVVFGKNEIIGGIKADEATSIEIYSSPKESVKRTGCLGFF